MTQELFEIYVNEAYMEFEWALGYPPGVARDQIFQSSRMKRSLGITYYKNNTYQVKINAALDDSLHPDRVKKILLHELLHTSPGCMNHGRPWKSLAAQIMECFPQYHITRLAKPKDYAVTRFKCKDCGVRDYVFSSALTKSRCPYCGRKMKKREVNRREEAA